MNFSVHTILFFGFRIPRWQAKVALPFSTSNYFEFFATQNQGRRQNICRLQGHAHSKERQYEMTKKRTKSAKFAFFFLEIFFFFHVYFINSKKIKQRDFIRQLPTIYIITLVFACVLINPDPIYFFTNKIHTNHTISTSWTNCCDLMNSKGHNQNWFPTLCLSSSLLRYVRMIFAFSCWQSSD